MAVNYRMETRRSHYTGNSRIKLVMIIVPIAVVMAADCVFAFRYAGSALQTEFGGEEDCSTSIAWLSRLDSKL